MVPDPVEGLGAQVQWRQRHVSSPLGMVIPAVHIGRQGVFAGVAPWTVAAVMAKGDGFGQGDVQAEAGGNGPRHLGYLQSMGQA